MEEGKELSEETNKETQQDEIVTEEEKSAAKMNDATDASNEPEDVVEVDEMTQLKNELGDMEDKFLRAQAEIANMRNRFQKERSDLAKYRSQDLAKAILPALDNLERALAIEVVDEQGTNLKKGIEMVMESLNHALKEEGIEEIKALGLPFDPNLHQAVQTVPASDDQKSDEVVQVLQKGYQLHDRVLRPSMVIVAQ